MMTLLEVFQKTKNGEIIPVSEVPFDNAREEVLAMLSHMLSGDEVQSLHILTLPENELIGLLKNPDQSVSGSAAYSLMHLRYPQLGLARYV